MGASFLNLVATKVTIKGEEQKFVSLRLHQSFNKHHDFTVIVNYLSPNNTFQQTPEKFINFIGETITISFTHRQTSDSYVFEGVVTKVEMIGSEGEAGGIAIHGESPTILFDSNCTLDSWTEQSLSAIINEATQEYGNEKIVIAPKYTNKVVEKWAKIAHDNKVMIYTDFADLEKPDDVIEMFFDSNLSGGDIYKSNVCMTCNYLVGRGRYAELGETEDLLVPPSAALAGSVYKTVMAQVTAGKKYGSMSEVDGVAFNLKKSEISEIEKIGLIPMVKEYGKVMAFSAKTLFNGDNLGLQTYSVVRVFDWVTKVLMDFLNRRAFENWNSKAERDLRSQISKFLDSIQGPGRLIEKFKILRFERDPKQKDRIFLDIHLTPYFPAKSFVIKLEGTKGDDENDWNSDYAQDA